MFLDESMTSVANMSTPQDDTTTDFQNLTTSVLDKFTHSIPKSSDSDITTSIPTPSYDEKNALLDYLEAENRVVMAPAIFFTGLVLPFAIAGNVIVLVVYRLRFKQSATRSFILTVASFDLLSTVFALPVEIYSMLHSVTFPDAYLCKAYVFIEQFSATASAATLVVFAIHRYQKICKPLKTQMTVTRARSLRLCVFMFSVGLCWPAFILYGIHNVPTAYEHVVGKCCGIQDFFNESVLPFVYRSVFLVMFFIGAVPITVLYIFVARKVLLLKRCKCKTALPYQKVMREMMFAVKQRSISESSWKSSRVSASSLRYSKNQSTMFATPKRTTLMIAITTLVIFISFLPNLIIRVLEYSFQDFVSNLQQPGLSLYHVFLRFYYLHCAANPIIYSAFSTKFRQQFQLMVFGPKKVSRSYLDRSSRY